ALSSLIGAAVGPHTSPLSRSRRYSTSPGRSVTGSFDHGVSWFSRLFSAHVNPPPSAATWKPNPGLAMTLIHGAGVVCPGPKSVTYSRPSAANPPSPLKNSRSFGMEAIVDAAGRTLVLARRGAGAVGARR